ncbi:MAG: hypothetical protein K9M96_10890 [Deltaproteobacteria bacterium]|nr:hypothetical protein [Deltaproteobacteria bacterium]
MRRFLSILMLTPLFLSNMTLVNAGSRLGFKELLLGSSLQDIQKDSRYHCEAKKDLGIADTVCMRYAPKETIAGAPIRLMTLFYTEGKLTNIWVVLKTDYFSQVLEALKEKYGNSETKKNHVQNKLGATFENVTYTWHEGRDEINATKYSIDLKTSTVSYVDQEAYNTFKKKLDLEAKENAEDL